MGIVFHIQKFSIHDGPGIRTTVFLKGCPLHCPWCSNPESQNSNIQLVWDHRKCSSCETCTVLYKGNLKFINDDMFANPSGKRLILGDVEEASAKQYAQHCPTGALSYEGSSMSVHEVMKEVEKDIPFYLESKGGLTLSGGEVLHQSRFAIDLLKQAKQQHIHTASETTCFAPPAVFQEFIQHVDLLLCDIKHYDEEKHKKVIGCSLELITQNILYTTSQTQVEVIARIPVIPGFNDSIEDAHGLSKRLLFLHIKKVNVLPYHNYGEHKYRLLERVYPYVHIDNVRKDSNKFQEYLAVFQSYGFEVS